MKNENYRCHGTPDVNLEKRWRCICDVTHEIAKQNVVGKIFLSMLEASNL